MARERQGNLCCQYTLMILDLVFRNENFLLNLWGPPIWQCAAPKTHASIWDWVMIKIKVHTHTHTHIYIYIYIYTHTHSLLAFNPGSLREFILLLFLKMILLSCKFSYQLDYLKQCVLRVRTRFQLEDYYL